MLALVEVMAPNVACGSPFEFPQPVAVSPSSARLGASNISVRKWSVCVTARREIVSSREVEIYPPLANQVIARAVSELRHNRVGEGGRIGEPTSVASPQKHCQLPDSEHGNNALVLVGILYRHAFLAVLLVGR